MFFFFFSSELCSCTANEVTAGRVRQMSMTYSYVLDPLTARMNTGD